MSEPKRIAVVRSYDEFMEALRSRIDELQLTHAAIDHISGVQAGYTSKVLAPNCDARTVTGKRASGRTLGRVSFGSILGALGIAIVVIEDEAALERVKRRLETREQPRQSGALLPAVTIKFSRRYLRRLAAKGGTEAWKHLTPSQRSRIMRKRAKRRREAREAQQIQALEQSALSKIPIHANARAARHKSGQRPIQDKLLAP